MLRRVARLIAEHRRVNDVVARYGGEEFALLLINADHRLAYRIPDRLRPRLHAEPLLVGVNLDELLNPAQYIGRAPEQVTLFVNQIVKSIRNAYGTRYSVLSGSDPRV